MKETKEMVSEYELFLLASHYVCKATSNLEDILTSPMEKTMSTYEVNKYKGLAKSGIKNLKRVREFLQILIDG